MIDTLTIRRKKCNGCQNCVRACLTGTIRMEGDYAKVDHEYPLCIKCLHCAAACPQDAIVFENVDQLSETAFSVDAFESEHSIENEIEHFLINRRSYRNFKDEQVPEEEIAHALDVASWAPSAANVHPAKWMIINEKDTLDQMMNHILEYVRETGISPEIALAYQRGKNLVMGQAGTIILVYAECNDGAAPHTDSVIAAREAELVLQSRGIGTCWSIYLINLCNQVPAIKKMLRIPEQHEIYAALFIGYPEGETYRKIPNRVRRTEIRWNK